MKGRILAAACPISIELKSNVGVDLDMMMRLPDENGILSSYLNKDDEILVMVPR